MTKTLFRTRIALLVGMALMALSACGNAPTAGTPVSLGNGTVKPENAVEEFFNTLNRSLKDPAIKNADARGRMVDQLAAYFAPNERDDQHVMIDAALEQFVTDMNTQLKPNETVSVEISYDELRTDLASDGSHAMVQPVNGAIHFIIAGDTTWEQPPVPLSNLIGREDGAIPVVRIGTYWFLTEG